MNMFTKKGLDPIKDQRLRFLRILFVDAGHFGCADFIDDECRESLVFVHASPDVGFTENQMRGASSLRTEAVNVAS
ncbi:MAG: hypothetical protein JWM32_1253 [Verrucomicrobia bacterium]|nr:hypothetical protein [Verrucomicrobiota bacterium]